jgi:hypothetical protein
MFTEHTIDLQIDKEKIVEEPKTAADAPESDPLIESKGDT